MHKINIVRLINLDTTPARLPDALHGTSLHAAPAPVLRRDLPRLARRLESDATNELDLFLATVYRLGISQAADLPVPAVGAPVTAGQYAAVKTPYAEVK